MAVTKQQVILEFNADTGGINKGLQQTDEVGRRRDGRNLGPCRSARQNDRGSHHGFPQVLGRPTQDGRVPQVVQGGAGRHGCRFDCGGRWVRSSATSQARSAGPSNSRSPRKRWARPSRSSATAFPAWAVPWSSFSEGDFKGALDDVKGAFQGITAEIVAEEIKRRANCRNA